MHGSIGQCLRTFALLAAVIGGAAGPVAGQTTVGDADRFDDVRAYIRDLMAERDLPSVAVAVAREGEILWQQGFGWADREHRLPATPHTLYSLASISKPITATALLALAERGRIDLEAPVDTYLGGGLAGRAGDASGATVRRVLSHTAGLPLHYQFFYEGEGYEPPPLRETIARYGALVDPPGTVYRYSNLGYGVLTHVIERVSGREYGEVLRTEVFAPLGMNRSAVELGPAFRPYVAARYGRDQSRLPPYESDHPGASEVYASAHDLVRFGLFHLRSGLDDQRRILADSMIDAMQRFETPDGGPRGYGLGWIIDADDHGYVRVGHTGSMPGVSTNLVLYPSERLVIAVLINALDRDARVRIAERIAAAVLPAYAARLEDGEQDDEAADRDRAFAPPPGLTGEWTGAVHTYEGEVPLTLVIRDDGDVHVRLGEQLRTLLNDATFRDGRLRGRFAGTIPTPDARRHPHEVLLDLRLRDGALHGQATARTPERPIHFALTSYVELTRRVAAR